MKWDLNRFPWDATGGRYSLSAGTGEKSMAVKIPSWRVLRGASWNNNDRDNLSSSYRNNNNPGNRNNNNGFRCVVGSGSKVSNLLKSAGCLWVANLHGTVLQRTET